MNTFSTDHMLYFYLKTENNGRTNSFRSVTVTSGCIWCFSTIRMGSEECTSDSRSDIQDKTFTELGLVETTMVGSDSVAVEVYVITFSDKCLQRRREIQLGRGVCRRTL